MKSLIGHTKATAGAAGLIKAALALHHRILPPHAGVRQPIEPLRDEACPVYLLTDAEPWLRSDATPRRAGVSAFGFGGTNFHAVLEEYRGSGPAHASSSGWPYELVVIRARTREALQQQVERLHKAIAEHTAVRLADLAYTCALRSDRTEDAPFCIAAVVDSVETLARAVQAAAEHLRGGAGGTLPPFVRVRDGADGEDEQVGKLAVLFPGQGSQYPDMLREAALYLEPLRGAVERASALLEGRFARPLGRLIFGPSAFSPEDEALARSRLTDTHVAQPAIGAIEAGCIEFARRLRIEPVMAAGHSYGEYAALHAAGALSESAFLALSEMRGRLLASVCAGGRAGTMAAVQIERERLVDMLRDLPGLTVANHNAPKQCVVSGTSDDIARLETLLGPRDVVVQRIAVAGAFHSSLMGAAHGPLAEAIAAASIQPPRIAVYSNVTGAPYPTDPDQIKAHLADHLLNPVEFMRVVERMYEDGARVFVELGPGTVLSRLVAQILEGRPFRCIPIDSRGGALQGVLEALGALTVAGVSLRLDALFDGRDVRELDLSPPLHGIQTERDSRTACFLSGGSVRAADRPVGTSGRRPFLDEEAVDASAKAAPAPRVAAPHAAVRAADRGPSTRPAPEVRSSSPAWTAAGVPEGETSHVLLEYQKVMRQFLSVQENVMRQFLAGGSGNAPAASEAEAIDAPAASEAEAIDEVRDEAVRSTFSETPVESPVDRQTQPPRPAPSAQPSNAATLQRDAVLDALLRMVSERTG